MEDMFLKLFAWVTPVLQEASITDVPLDQAEQAVLNELEAGWGTTDTAELLKRLTAKYGEMACRTIERVLAKRIREDWALTGAREAHPGTEIADFIRILWEPLRQEGFNSPIRRQMRM